MLHSLITVHFILFVTLHSLITVHFILFVMFHSLITVHFSLCYTHKSDGQVLVVSLYKKPAFGLL